MPTTTPRSQTRDLKSFTLVLGSGPVTFSFPSLHRTRIAIPPGSLWRPGPHWHESYVEHMRVVQGTVKFTVNGTTTVVGPEDEPRIIRPYDVHDFCRADSEDCSEDVVVEEWTEPSKQASKPNTKNPLGFVALAVTDGSKRRRLQASVFLQRALAIQGLCGRHHAESEGIAGTGGAIAPDDRVR